MFGFKYAVLADAKGTFVKGTVYEDTDKSRVQAPAAEAFRNISIVGGTRNYTSYFGETRLTDSAWVVAFTTTINTQNLTSLTDIFIDILRNEQPGRY